MYAIWARSKPVNALRYFIDIKPRWSRDVAIARSASCVGKSNFLVARSSNTSRALAIGNTASVRLSCCPASSSTPTTATTRCPPGAVLPYPAFAKVGDRKTHPSCAFVRCICCYVVTRLFNVRPIRAVFCGALMSERDRYGLRKRGAFGSEAVEEVNIALPRQEFHTKLGRWSPPKMRLGPQRLPGVQGA